MKRESKIRPLFLALSIVMVLSGPMNAWASADAASKAQEDQIENVRASEENKKETEKETKASKETTSAPKETTPAAKETTPAAKETTPAAKETTPAAKETTSAAKETTPAAKETESSKATEASKETESSKATEASKETESSKETDASKATTAAPSKEETTAPQKPEETTKAEETLPESTEDETTDDEEERQREIEKEREKKKKEQSKEAETNTDTSEDETKKETKSGETKKETKADETKSAEAVFTFFDDGIIEAVLPTEYRFTKINKSAAILKDGAKILTKKDEKADVVAEAEGNNPAYVIVDSGKWLYIEVGYNRGYVKAEDLIIGDEADVFCNNYEASLKAQEAAGQSDEQAAAKFGSMKVLIDHMDNPAFADTLTTTMEVRVDKVYVVANENINVYDTRKAGGHPDDQGSDEHIIGTLKKGGLAYLISDADKKVVYIESGDVRGFVLADKLTTGDAAIDIVKKTGEFSMDFAKTKVDPEKNRAFYYTVTSTGAVGTSMRNAVISFALQFVGNKYVWGGTSLTKGTDCSGFVQSVYRHFGYSLPRTSAAQRYAGKNVGTDLKNALPGDLICYDGHVAIYLGDGKIVHASNSKPYPRGGIKVSKNAAYRKILTIRRIINEIN